MTGPEVVPGTYHVVLTYGATTVTQPFTVSLDPRIHGIDAVAGPDSAIDDLVQLKIQSSEGSLLHETKPRSHLAYLAADIDLAYGAPTAAPRAVFEAMGRAGRTPAWRRASPGV